MAGLAPLAFVGIVAAVILLPFRRRIGGVGGGSEKAIVGGLWVLAMVVIAVAIAT